MTRTHYWFQHEPCWYVRKKNAPWFGQPGENTTIWDAASPKMIMGGFPTSDLAAELKKTG
ncbi:MAG TPA: hypothetical protein VMB85_21165 [Bryobacteraceae bacterium]|nr:hypothetical protein [Bryobacteraceae bacterium]